MSTDIQPAETTPPGSNLRTVTLYVPALENPEHLKDLEAAWAPLEGVLEIRTDLLRHTATALIDPTQTPVQALESALRSAGLPSEPDPRLHRTADPVTILLQVPDMDSPVEVALIESTLEPLEGIRRLETNLLDRTATIEIDRALLEPAAVERALRAIGLRAHLGPGKEPPAIQFHIPRASERGVLTELMRAAESLTGVSRPTAEVSLALLSIPYDPHRITPDEIHQALLATGHVVQAIERGPSRGSRFFDQPLEIPATGTDYNVSAYVPPPEPTGGVYVAPPPQLSAAEEPAAAPLIDDETVIMGIGLLLWGLGTTLFYLAGFQLAGKIVLALVALAMGWRTLMRAGMGLRQLRIDMNTLMSVAAIGAFLLGEFVEGALLLWLFALAMRIERWNLQRTKAAVQHLVRRRPSRVRILTEGSWDQVAIERVTPGTRVLVRPGELIPLDGIVVAGQSAVDEAALTGEPIPLDKGPGAPVFGGTLCMNGALEYLVTNDAAHSTLDRIRDLVTAAQTQKAPIQQTMDRFAATYTPIVLVLAALIATVPPLVWSLTTPGVEAAALHAVRSVWLYRGLAVLVVACPCALVISTPVAFIAALGFGARHGLLIKGGRILEALAQVKALAFDKTGTLTRGEPELTGILPVYATHGEIAALALALETNATHPLAIAVGRYAAQHGIKPAAGLEGFRQIGGRGVEGRIGNLWVGLGSIAFLHDRKVDFDAPSLELLRKAEKWGATLVGVAAGRRLAGLLAFVDPLRPEAAEAIEQLRALGIERMELMTGDNHAVARRVAETLGLDAVYANLLPQDKQDLLEQLSRQWGRTGMVGDGLNDAPALGAAAVGIALGERGADLALETADVVLLGEDLRKLPLLIEHARTTVQVIQQNIGIALGLKAAVLILIALVPSLRGLLLVAILADMGSSLLVTGNSLRLLSRRDAPAKAKMPG